MIFAGLNASGYDHNELFYHAEFKDILAKIIACYKLMLADEIRLYNDENKIRDVLLLNYLRNNTVRSKVGLTDYSFNREVPEDVGFGRTDIKVETLNTFIDTSAYYTIECKRLDSVNPTGKSGLNAKYIKNGICRFVSNTYSTYYHTNGMIGFVVHGIDIHKNIKSINNLMANTFTVANATTAICKFNLIEGFEFSYSSKHSKNGSEIIIYHLMFDFSKNI